MDRRTPVAIALGAMALACASGALDSPVLYRPPADLPTKVDLSPEGDARIDGHVSRETGARVEGAWVTITCACLNAPIDLVTDETGLYQALGLPTGAYSVRVRHRSFEAAKVLTLEAGRRVRINMQTRESPTIIT